MAKHEPAQFNTLQDVSLELLYQVFSKAFSHYQIPTKLTEQEFLNRMRRVGVDKSYSGGVFLKGVLSGFILTALGGWEGQKTAYNAGTGILPNKRGKGFSEQIYRFLLPTLREMGVKQCLLEVITTNEPAIRVYKKLGFEIARKVLCFRQDMSIPIKKSPLTFQIIRADLPDWDAYSMFAETAPTWQNSPRASVNNFEHEILLEALHRYQTIGFIIFEPVSGRVSQLGVHPEFRENAVGNNLLRAARGLSQLPLSMLNIDERGGSLINFLRQSCFGNPVSQFEMVLAL